MRSSISKCACFILSCIFGVMFSVGPLAAQDTLYAAIFRNVGVVQLSSNQPGELSAAWDVPEEAPDDYRIRWAKVGESYLNWTDSSGNAFPTSPSYTITGLVGGERYKVQVRPRYEEGPRPWSNEVGIRVMASPATSPPPATNTPPPPHTSTPVPLPTNTPPPPPTNTSPPPPTNTPLPPPSDTPDLTIGRIIGAIHLTSNQPGVLTASWNAPEETPLDYRFSWAKVGESFLTWTVSSGNAFPASPSYTVTGLEGGLRYKVRARPRYQDGPRPWTDVFEVAVMAALTDTPVPPSNTPAPTDTPIPPSNTPAPTDTRLPSTSAPPATDRPRSENSQSLGRSVNPNQQSNEPGQQPAATPTATRTPTATATATSSATETLDAESQNQPTSWPNQPPNQQLTPPKQSTATPTREFARQHGGTETHTPAPTNTPHPDRVALEAIYDALDGDDWTGNDGWNTNRGLHNWYGVTTSDGRVTKLVLSNNSLNGSLPAAIGNLTELEELVLSNHNGSRNLRGAIPPEIGNLRNLKVLSLFNNRLTGSIPTEMGNLRDLEDLSLAFNRLSGSIPTQLGNLRDLTRLDLGPNDLSGSIPAQLGNLNQLVYLNMSQNDLSGSIPSGMGNLRSLVELNLSENELSGSIPSSFNNFRSVMKRLYLSRNQLSGPIPLYLLNFTELDTLHLSFNNFTGCMPNGLRRAIRHHDFGGISLELCTNTLTDTPVPTNTPVPTATLDPLTPTATPAPAITTFSVTGNHQSVKVSYNVEAGLTRTRVFWRQAGHSTFQQSDLQLGITSGPTWSYDITGLQSDVAYEVYMQGYNDNNVALGRTSVKRVRTPKDLRVHGVRLSAGVNSLEVTWNTADHHSHYHIRWEREKGGGFGYDSGIENNSYTIRGLEAGETYEVQVSVTDFDNGTGPWSARVSGRARSGGIEPTRLAGPTVTQDGGNLRLVVSWPLPSVATGESLRRFELRLDDQNQGTTTYHVFSVQLDNNSDPESPQSRILGVGSYDNTYRVAVRVNTHPGGWGVWSSETSITIPTQTGGIDPADDYVPSRVTALTLSTSDTTTNKPKVGIAWTAPNTGATNALLEYELHYVSDNDSTGRSFKFSATGSNDNAITAVNVIGLPVRRWYTFRLRARNATGLGAWSPTNRIYLPDSGGNLTPLPTNTSTPAPRAPGVPADLSVWAITDDQDTSYVQFGWSDPADEGTSRITRFVVRYRWSGQDWIEVDRGGARTFFVLKTGDADHPAVYQRRYEFQVAAVSDVGQGRWSGSVYGTPLKAPDMVDEPTLVAGTGQLRVSWTRPDSNDRGITHYQLFYAQNNANSSNSMTIERITGTSYTITGLTSGVEYKVAVRAVSSVGEGNWSQYAIGTPD